MLSGNRSAVSFGKLCRKCAKIVHEKNDNNFIRFGNYLCNYGTWLTKIVTKCHIADTQPLILERFMTDHSACRWHPYNFTLKVFSA